MTAIFMESCMNLRRQYHLCIHCIPVPQEIGEMSPIYFKVRHTIRILELS